MPKKVRSILGNFLYTTALAVVLFFPISCSEDNGLVRPGAGASLSDQQKRAAADIDAIIAQQLGETDGLCKGGYGKYEKCFKQELYRLLTKYYRTSISKLTNNKIANPVKPPVFQTAFEIDVPAIAENDVIYLVTDFAIYGPTTNGVQFTLELVHIDNDSAQTRTVLETAHSSLSGSLKFKRVPMSASYTASGATRPGKFALQVKTSLPANENGDWHKDTDALILDATSQLTALHYKVFTVDDIFGDDSKATGFYQVEGYSHSTLAPDLVLGGLAGKQTKNTIFGTGKKLLENLTIKNLEKDDILVLRFSGSFDYTDSFHGCQNISKITFGFVNVKESTITPMGTSIPALLTKTGDLEIRAGDVQFIHGMHVLDILEDKPQLNLNIKVDQEGAGSDDCKITFRNDANSLALTYEVYRPVSKLKENFYLGKFLAEVSSIRENDDRHSTAPNYTTPSTESFVTTPSIPLMGGDVVFSDGGFNIAAGTLGIAGGYVNSEISLKEVLLESNTTTSHIIRHTFFDRHAQDHLYVHRALDIFESVIPKGERKSGRFQIKGKFFNGTKLSDPAVPIVITESSAHYRIFRQFDSEDKAAPTAE